MNNATKFKEEASVTSSVCTRMVELVPPDGGFGWVVVLGGFTSMVFSSLPLFGFGILYSPLLSKFNASSTKVSWIFGLHSVVWNVFVILLGPLNDEFGWRKVALVGGGLNFASIFLSGFAPSPDFLFFSFSVLGGVGGSIGVSLTFVVVSRYFERHRAFALGISTLGMCASAFVSPLLSDHLLDQYGFLGATTVFSAVVLNQCVSASVFQPIEWHMKPRTIPEDVESIKLTKESCREVEKPREISPGTEFQVAKVNDNGVRTPSEAPEENRSILVHLTIRILRATFDNCKALKYKRVIILSVTSSCLMMAYICFLMWVPFVVMNLGYSRQLAAWCISGSSITNAVARVLTSLLSEWRYFRVRVGYHFAMLSCGLLVIAFSLVTQFKLLVVISCFWGFSIGVAFSLHPTVLIDVMGVKLFPAVFGVCSCLTALFWLVISPTLGFIRDVTSSYQYPLWCLGGMELFAVFLWSLLPLATKFDMRKMERME